MTIIYLIGGLGESTLAQPSNVTGDGYPNPTTILLGKARIMTLAANGVDPGPPHGVELAAAAGLPGYMDVPQLALAAQYGLGSVRIRVWAWDWRKQIYPAGQALAASIRRDVEPEDPCTLVGHSAGGLVARAAWTDLGTTGETALIRRIVTLGTPHWGSYAMVQFFQGNNSAIDVMQYWNITVGGNSAGWAPGITGYVALSTLDYQLMAITWPAFYEVLPVLGAPSAAADPDRLLLYDAANWPAAYRPQQAWLDHAKNVTGPWLRSAASQPPPDVLTCCAGTGYTSATKLDSPAGFARGSGLGGYADGDGLVAGIDAIIPGSTAYYYVLLHDNFMVALGLSGQLKGLIDQTNPVPTPQPQLTSTEVFANYVQPIPATAIPTLSPNTGPSCTPGVCSC